MGWCSCSSVLVCSITVVLGKGCFLCVDFAGSVTGMLLPCAEGFFLVLIKDIMLQKQSNLLL